jgi:integrase
MAKARTWTDNAVKNLKPRKGQRQTDYSDPAATGLILRVTTQSDGTHRRQWRRKYRVAGSDNQRTLIIGEYPEVGLAAARNEAARVKDLAKRGYDPLKELHEAETERAAAGSFSELVATVLEDGTSPKTRKPYSTRSLGELRRSLSTVSAKVRKKPALDMTAKDVGGEVIAAYKRAKANGGQGVMANRLVSHISAVYRRAQQLQLVPIGCNPAREVQPPAGETSRDRVLSSKEIAKLWAYFCGTHGQAGPGIRFALKLNIVTAQRIGEVCSARVNDIDRDAGTWTIRNSKNNRTHVVPLSSLALATIDEAINFGPDENSGGLLFPSPSASGHLRPDSVNTALSRDRQIIGINERWTPHDLRRTAATGMGRLGVNRFVLSRVLNHVDASVDGIYDRHDYLAEKRQALNLWAEEIERVINGAATKVVPIKKGARS